MASSTRRERMAKRMTAASFAFGDPLDGNIADTLDLHGFNRDQACARVPGYLRDARQRFPGQLVHIITGKGRNSPGQPVLLPTVRRLLKSAPQSQVADWGPDADGGGYL